MWPTAWEKNVHNNIRMSMIWRVFTVEKSLLLLQADARTTTLQVNQTVFPYLSSPTLFHDQSLRGAHSKRG